MHQAECSAHTEKSWGIYMPSVEKTPQIASMEINNRFDSSSLGFFESYLDYAGIGESEAPTTFHRWSCASMIGALLGRQAYLPFGHSNIYPNQYIMLMGSPGARKGTAINIAKSLLKAAGYNRFGPDKSSKEQFLSEMKQYDDDMDAEDLEVLSLDEPSEVYVVAGEFTDFVGQNNMDFVTLLTNLWDNLPEYKNPKRTAKHVMVHQPTINIIGGNTPQGFALAFPPESIGNGFMSRLILVHGEPTGTLVPWPAPADALVGAELTNHLKEVKAIVKGEFTKGNGVETLGARIYKECVPVDDHRFKHYATRRFTHLLKLAMILAASDLSTEIQEEHMLKANTMLHFTENHMPKALGEFGKSKYSEVSHTILEILGKSKKPVTLNDLWKRVVNDLSKLSELGDIMKNLQHAGKVQLVQLAGKQGFLPMHEEKKEWAADLILPEWLTMEERM
jgi:hypothetical protein